LITSRNWGTKRIEFTHFGEWMINDPEKGKKEIREYSNDIKVEAAMMARRSS